MFIIVRWCLFFIWIKDEQMKHESQVIRLLIGRIFCRDICAECFVNNRMRISDPDYIVKIDESCFGKRKYNCGPIIREQQ